MNKPGALLLFSLLLATSFPVWCDQVIVDTPQGKLQGNMEGEGSDAVRVFKGIPYALPPVGNRRWKPPEQAHRWDYLRKATAFSPACPQPSLGKSGGTAAWPMPQTSEDCLYLNVWTTAKAGEKQPVMVWIHGGGQVAGSGEIDAAPLARKGVVVVSINYRLGVLGYFAHPELSAESSYSASGNYGLQDQIHSLKWVHDNIADFGGDPDNVTIFGCSGGGTSVQQVVTSPLSKGLFHRAIAESGTPFYPFYDLKKPYLDKPSAESIGLNFGKENGAFTLAALRNLPAEALINTWPNLPGGAARVLLVVDGWSIPDQPYDMFARGEQNDVPVIVGFTADEGSSMGDFGLVPSVPASRGAYISKVKKQFGDLAGDYLADYPADNVEDSVFAATRDGMFGWGMHTWAKLTANVSSDAYLYYFAHEPPGANNTASFSPGDQQRRLGVFHGAEVVFVFNNFDLSPDFLKLSPIEQKIQKEMAEIVSDYWVTFATTGNPHPKGLPAWPAYDDTQRGYMRFEKGAANPSHNLNPEQWAVYDKINAKRREQGMSWDHPDNGINISLTEKK